MSVRRVGFVKEFNSVAIATAFAVLMQTHCYADEDNTVRQADTRIREVRQKFEIPGISATILVDGKPVLSKGYGFADIEQSVPVTPQTLMRVGSLSKAMTATAIIRAAEMGVINIDETVQAYLPGFRSQEQPISLRQLGGHLGGIRHYANDEEMRVTKHYETVGSSLTLFSTDPLVSVPGSKYLYSSFGFNLLSAAFEKATNQSLLGAMDMYLWSPVGMARTDADDVVRIIGGRARYYEKSNDGVIVNAPFVDNSYKISGGGMLSTSEDLALLAGALIDDKYISQASKNVLFTSQVTSTGEVTGYGFGWFVDMNKFLDDRVEKIPEPLYLHLKKIIGNRELFWHSGTSAGSTAMLLFTLQSKVAVSIVSNMAGVEPYIMALAMELEAMFSTPQ